MESVLSFKTELWMSIIIKKDILTNLVTWDNSNLIKRILYMLIVLISVKQESENKRNALEIRIFYENIVNNTSCFFMTLHICNL